MIAASTGSQTLRPPLLAGAVPAAEAAPALSAGASFSLESGLAAAMGENLATLQVNDVLEDAVGHRDEPGASLEAALRRDELGELVGQVDVRGLERAGLDEAETGGAGIVGAGENAAADRAGHGDAGVKVGAVAHQRARVVEALELDAAGGGRRAVGVGLDHVAGGVEAYGLQFRADGDAGADLHVADRTTHHTLQAQAAGGDQEAVVIRAKLAA